jgi:hypothetical protein
MLHLTTPSIASDSMYDNLYVSSALQVLQSRRYASSPTTQSALRTARLNRPRGYFDAPYLTGLPGAARDSLSDMLPSHSHSASVNDMIALEDFGRGPADSAVFVNDHNPFHVNGTRRAGIGTVCCYAVMCCALVS